jgi:hypothetical protein
LFQSIRNGSVSRKRAFSLHLLISVSVVSTVLFVLSLFWYPGDYFVMAGVWAALQVLIFVDVVLGPSLTLLLFKPGKPGLMFDMSVVVLMQVAALLYGVSVIYKERPYFLVFVVDRYELISKYEIDLDELRYDTLVDRPLTDLIHVYAQRPEDPQALSEYTESVMDGQPDLERRPEFWMPYTDGADRVIETAWPLEYLRSLEHADQTVIDRAVEEFAGDRDNIGYLPVSSKRHDYSMLIDLDNAEPLGIIRVYPWDDYEEPEESGWLSSIIGAKLPASEQYSKGS